MKRSEVIHAISDNVLSSFMPETDLRIKNLIADCLLAEVEKLGMKPPGYEGRMANGEKYDPKMGPVDTCWFKNWEPETQEQS